jgi:hypothetical protein
VRDLASRLRAIVQSDRQERARSQSSVEPDLPGIEDGHAAAEFASHPDELARALGGRWIEASSGGSCLLIDRTWDPFRSHGRRRINDCVIDPSAPIGLFDKRIAAVPDWTRKLVFFDIETTGLSGGAGTVAFLAGCGWFNDDGFTVRQFLMTGPAGERALLEALEKEFGDASVLVSYNGRTFDVPTMEMRWAFHRRPAPTDDLPHFDMLPIARRLWGFRASGASRTRGEAQSCALSALERSVLRFHRLDDVPGFEIPARYFHFVRSGDPSVIEGVLEHNRHDIVSLAVLTSHALSLIEGGPDACIEATELMGIGRCYERAGDLARAEAAFARAAEAAIHDGRELRGYALAFLAELQRRDGRIDDAARTWEQILEDGAAPRRTLAGHERRAAEALAIYHEHRGKDPEAAKKYAESLRGGSGDASGRRRDEIAHRLARLDRKIARTNNKGGHSAAPLLDS